MLLAFAVGMIRAAIVAGLLGDADEADSDASAASD
jgi:hypothetical protein